MSKEKDRNNKAGKKRLNKEDVAMPTNFQHISHVGWDPNHGFDLENVDSNLKKFFHKAKHNRFWPNTTVLYPNTTDGSKT